MAIPIEEKEEQVIQIYERWDEYNLKEEVLRGIYACGFEVPSFIQKTAIMPIITGRDIRAQAQSGTGKTAAFGIGALQRLSPEKKTQILILVSTREIAEQNANRIETLSQFMDINITVLSGGTDVSAAIDSLRRNPEIVAGTPGRVFHMIEQGHLKTEDISLLIIDEADEMLNFGFKDQVKEIFCYLPQNMQVAMFSATWEAEEMEVAKGILRNPVVIDLRQDEQTLKGIDQFSVCLGPRPARGYDMRKVEALIDIYKKKELSQCIIFVNTRNKAKFVHNVLQSMKIPADMIHSDLTQKERIDVLNKFRNGSCRLLIATGLIGRGIDIQQLSLVFNFDIPKSTEKCTYIHRIGRAGRFGKKGKAINFIYDDELENLKEIERHYQTIINPLPQDYDLK
ncbi:translation initiation factor eIF4A [Conglomerata obtusa]